MVEDFIRLLQSIKRAAGNDFSGVGLIVCDPEVVLPTFPMKPWVPLPSGGSAVGQILKISALECELHDGFHLLSRELKLFAAAQYFSPPVDLALSVDVEGGFGGRYFAALFGSIISGVECTGIVTHTAGLAVFKDGKKIYSENA
ncbi:MAG: hypothetical protein CMK72_16170 [Pseudomonadaceae bacterium]|nr:hypothetical protein [Pseudomonadaceae bacterium]HCP53545.1 hypothetical protein [Pseudomonas sp.]|tara:strand:+ start:101 stop:532 length:432 start_codon:yes stop_codon:yes gene_type:complete